VLVGSPEGVPGFGVGRPKEAPGFGVGRPREAPGFGVGRPKTVPGFGVGRPKDAPGFGVGNPKEAPGFGVGSPSPAIPALLSTAPTVDLFVVGGAVDAVVDDTVVGEGGSVGAMVVEVVAATEVDDSVVVSVVDDTVEGLVIAVVITVVGTGSLVDEAVDNDVASVTGVGADVDMEELTGLEDSVLTSDSLSLSELTSSASCCPFPFVASAPTPICEEAGSSELSSATVSMPSPSELLISFEILGSSVFSEVSISSCESTLVISDVVVSESSVFSEVSISS